MWKCSPHVRTLSRYFSVLQFACSISYLFTNTYRGAHLGTHPWQGQSLSGLQTCSNNYQIELHHWYTPQFFLSLHLSKALCLTQEDGFSSSYGCTIQNAFFSSGDVITRYHLCLTGQQPPPLISLIHSGALQSVSRVECRSLNLILSTH